VKGKIEVDVESNAIDIPKFYAMDAEKIGTGAYEPVHGFMDENEINRVIKSNELLNGKIWTMPIFLSTNSGENLREGDQIMLRYDGQSFAEMDIESVFIPDVRRIAAGIYGTDDLNHPGVRYIRTLSGKFLAGEVRLQKRIKTLGSDPTPAEIKNYFRTRRWRTVAGYQTRNPPHRAHEYIQRVALEIMDGLFINPVVGELKEDDFDEHTIMECYNYLADTYYPKGRVLVEPLHIAMRYAGPKAAAFFALIRRNYGCTHFLVGRDMAGIGNYYEPSAARDFLSTLDLGIEIIGFDDIYHCERCGTMVSSRSCPHGMQRRDRLSMSSIREIIRRGERPPESVMRSDIADIIIRSPRKELPEENSRT